jgi:hypothetical protein
MKRQWWWLLCLGLCAAIGAGYMLGLASDQPTSQSRDSGNLTAPNVAKEPLSKYLFTSMGVRFPAPRFEPTEEVLTDRLATAASAPQQRAPARGAIQPPAKHLAPVEKPVPMGAGMAARSLVAGGEQKGTALDRVWEPVVRQPIAVNPQPASAPDWRVMGAVQRGETAFLLVKFDGQPETRMLKLGDKLPGGGTVGWVKPNALGVIYGKQETLDVPILQGQIEQERLRRLQAGKVAKP